MIRVKVKAALIHAIITLVVALLGAVLVYQVWYPNELALMVGGDELYWMIIAVEVFLGPAMSLVIFNPTKLRREIVLDYSIVGAAQCMALLYGLYIVSVSRPVYLVFVKDRIEVVSAVELRQADMDESSGRFATLGWFGPDLICVQSPSDPVEKSDLLQSALEGKDIQLLPKYYRECKDGEIIRKAYDKDQLQALTSIDEDQLPRVLFGKSFSWLPVVSRFGAWTVFFKENDVHKAMYVDVNPFAK